MTDLQPLATVCAKLENQHSAAEQKLLAYVDNVRQSMIAESLRRITLYNIKLSMNNALTPEEKQKKRDADKAVIDPAMLEYNNIVGDSTKGIKKTISDDILKLAPTKDQSCVDTAQMAVMAQNNGAGLLIAIPPKLCSDITAAYKEFTTALNAVYNQINVQPPS